MDVEKMLLFTSNKVEERMRRTRATITMDGDWYDEAYTATRTCVHKTPLLHCILVLFVFEIGDAQIRHPRYDFWPSM